MTSLIAHADDVVGNRADGRQSEAILIGEKSPYAANLCPLSGRVELAGLGEDFGESIGELV